MCSGDWPEMETPQVGRNQFVWALAGKLRSQLKAMGRL